MEQNKDALLDELKLLLDRFFHTMKHLSQDAHLRGDLGDGQVFLLLTLVEAGGSLRASDLARNLGLTNGAVTLTCDKLEKMGLILRERSDQDRRAVWVGLTDKGKEAILQIQNARFNYVRSRLGSMSELDLQRAVIVLEQFIQRLNPPGDNTHGKNN